MTIELHRGGEPALALDQVGSKDLLSKGRAQSGPSTPGPRPPVPPSVCAILDKSIPFSGPSFFLSTQRSQGQTASSSKKYQLKLLQSCHRLSLLHLGENSQTQDLLEEFLCIHLAYQFSHFLLELKSKGLRELCFCLFNAEFCIFSWALCP